jgi:hypothetical protein
MGKRMSQPHRHERSLSESLIAALAWGGFLIIVGAVFGLTPGLSDAIGDLLGDLTGVTYPGIYGTIMLPAPANPASHQTVYQAIFNFILAIGVLQIIILAARLLVHSPIKRIAETVGNLIWWVGAQ